jgi:hypothetical protein
MDKKAVAAMVRLVRSGAVDKLVDEHDAVLVAVDKTLDAQHAQVERALARAGITPGTPQWQAWEQYENLMLQECHLYAVAGVMIGAVIERPDGMLAQILSRDYMILANLRHL